MKRAADRQDVVFLLLAFAIGAALMAYYIHETTPTWQGFAIIGGVTLVIAKGRLVTEAIVLAIRAWRGRGDPSA